MNVIYYNEQGQVIPAESIDLERGCLVDRTTAVHPAEVHNEQKRLPGGCTLIYPVIDKQSYVEVTEQTYIQFSNTPSIQDRLEAQVAYTAMMTDTVLEV